MKSDLFRLNLEDVGKGLLVAVLSAVFLWLGNALQVPGFTWESLDWGALVNVAMAAGVGYLSKNFFSDSEGKVLGLGR